jgi:hypothetical protein
MSIASACFRARLSRMQRVRLLASGRLAARRKGSAIRAGCARADECLVVRVDQQAGSCVGERDDLLEREKMALRLPAPSALVQQPEPGDVSEQAEGPGDAALVRQVGREGLVGDQRFVDLETDQRPRPDAEEGRIGLSEWHGGDGRAGVVRGDGDHLRALSGSSDRCRWAVRPPEAGGSGCPGVPGGRRPSRCTGSKHCVVVAFVNSLDLAPQSRW